MQLAGSLAVANRPAEAGLCLESRASISTRVYYPNYPNMGFGEHLVAFAHTAGPGPYQLECATNTSLIMMLDGRDLLVPCASLSAYRWALLDSEVGCEGQGAAA